MFSISTSPIQSSDLRQSLAHPKAGALVVFEGWVRNHNHHREVLALEYEAFETLAIKEGLKIIGKAKEKFDITDVKCVHRTGRLDIGEMAVWVGVTAPHRKAAFEACETIIDEVKVRLPIWKKEYYIDGDSGWVNCETCSKLHH